ncbi:MAG: ATP-binding protein, partial [Methanomicrobiales archaeon]
GKAYQENGKTKKVSGIFQDITERRQSEEALHESELFNRGLVENLPDYVIVYGQDGKILYTNPAAERAFLNNDEKLVGKSVLSFVADEDRDTVITHIATREKGGTVPPYEIDIGIPGGPRVSVIVKGTPVQYHNNPATLLLLTDITEHNQLELEMQYHEQELRQFSTALSIANKKLTLLSGITRHDINNQLLVLNGFLSLLHKKVPDPTLDDFFTRIMMASDRISAMIRFTRTYECIGVNVPVWQVVRDLVDAAAKDVTPGRISLKNDLPAGEEIFADPLIIKVFYNLIDNAVRYGGKITTIRFSTKVSGDDHLIICEDDGAGIPADEKEKIFERGFGKNTGLGLFLSREILAITGITITETGEPGKGARFEMVVPKGIWRMV